MQSPLLFLFFYLLSLFSVLEPALAGSITFNSEDGVDRVIHFTGNAGAEEIGELHVGPGESIAQSFPDGWIGNFYATCAGCPDEAGMLGEVAFNGFEGKTFYDVSAIVGPDDHSGVHRFSPSAGGEQAGCDDFPCPESTYYQPDDVQTKVTDQSDLSVSLSGGGGGGGSGSGSSGYESDGGDEGSDGGGDEDGGDGDDGDFERRVKRRVGFKRRSGSAKPNTHLYMVPIFKAPKAKSA